MSRRCSAVGLSLFAATLGLAASTAIAQDVVVKIGHFAPLSGPSRLVYLGKESELGARVAINELNATGIRIGGKTAKFELMSEDDGADPKQGTAVAQKLVDAKVSGVVGGLNSGTTVPAARIFSDAGIPQISPWATNPAFTRSGYKTSFRLVANDDWVGHAMGIYTVRGLKIKRVAAIDDQTPYGRASASAFEDGVRRAGGQVLPRESTGSTNQDFTSIISRLKTTSPEAVFFGGANPAQAGSLLRQFGSLNTKPILVGADGICSADLPKLSGGNASRGRVFCGEATAPGFDSPRSYAYDAVKLLAAAMVKAGSSDPRVYLSALAQTDRYKGATGTISFDAAGDRKDAPVSIYTFAGEERALADSGTEGGCPNCPSNEVCCTENSKKVCKSKCETK